MMRKFFQIFLVSVIGLFFLEGCDMLGTNQPVIESNDFSLVLNKPLPPSQRKRVLVLHSYHPEYAWIQNINKGVTQGFLEERFDVQKNMILQNFYMDTKRKSSKSWKLEIARKAIEKITQWKPHVVIATDDNAQAFVVSKMKGTAVPFVFLGVNANPMKYGYIDSLEEPNHNVTGCIERERFEQTISLLKRLKPGIKRLAVVCDDGPTGVPVIKRVIEKAPKIGIEIVASKQIGIFSEWKKYVRAQQKKADALLVIVYHTLRDDQGRHVSDKEVLYWTISNNKLPDIGFWSWAIEGGLLCSEAISGYQQGHYAATVASYVMRGQSPGEFAVDMPRRGESCINEARAKMLGLQIPSELRKTTTIFKTIQSEG